MVSSTWRLRLPAWLPCLALFIAAGFAPGSVPGAQAYACGAPTPSTRVHALTWLRAVAHYLDGRSSTSTVAVYDYVAKRWHMFHHSVSGVTASIVKVDILETLLHQTHGSLSQAQRRLATEMIEQSDNDAASTLWREIGYGEGLSSYNEDVGTTHTTPDPSGAWGLTNTTSVDQVRILRRLVKHNSLLTDASRRYELSLMRNVTTCQRWGVNYGVPSGVTVALKNGWLPMRKDYSDWEINSIGYVHGDRKRYAVAVLTQGNPTMAYGQASVERIGAITWKFMRRRPA